MKTLHFFFVVLFLVLSSQARLHLWSTGKLKDSKDPETERAAYQADENGQAVAPPQDGKISCLWPWGYCLLRKLRCASGFVMKERFNNCPNTRTLKCCVL
ncbi:Hypothetical predicted protein [Podarcis lilfordi]|uniref:Uncharacterized protein n=1 Tax=Podarcis lilfordi TaxID=74358 RepID=A0AA35K640_9SAUR|nr:Hypothetical predicted protein [Podarcis lilfordi]